ncbi:GPP34 family phosphoprotein [Actinopolymorpha sp. NPDC004070]|uniref:GOLPH3/VPS74 family protein n=1 Tax=Actinopolymorpha sp. NPDC004070 TaxID=3154548 RepID=UPI0033B2AEE4
MTTPRDLLIVVVEVMPDQPVEQGNLSLALAGAELIDLLQAQTVRLDDDQIVPTGRSAPGDRLLENASSSLARQAPYESVDNWLWRRGRNLSATYVAGLEAEGEFTRQRGRHRNPFRAGQLVLADSPARSDAEARWDSDEPVLTRLAATLGIHGRQATEVAGAVDDSVAVVLAAVEDAVRQLEFERQRRAIEEAAYDNVWRDPQ